MNLQLAVASTCAGAGCRVRLLADHREIAIDYSQPLKEHGIIILPGDLVAVDSDTDPLQAVFRWSFGRVEAKEGNTSQVRFSDGDIHTILPLEGTALEPAAGDAVFVANGRVCDMAVADEPAHPERLAATFFPQIQAMYEQMRKWDAFDPKQVVREGYDRLGAHYAEWAQTVRTSERARYTSLLLDQFPAGARVLELGCGPGVPTTQELAKRFQVIAVDFSASQLDLARQAAPNAQFIQADMTRLEFCPASVDAVAAFYSFVHVPRDDQLQLVGKIASWLRPRGLFVAAMGTHSVKRDFDEDWLGVRMFWSGFNSETNQRIVQQAGMRILSAREETAEEFGVPVTFLWVVAQKG